MKTKLFTIFAAITASLLICSCSSNKYQDPDTNVEYNLPEGVEVTNQSTQSQEKSKYRFSFEGDGVIGKVFHMVNPNEDVDFDEDKIFAVPDSTIYDDMAGWTLLDVDKENYGKIYADKNGKYRKNYVKVSDHNAEFIEVIQSSQDFSKFDKTVKDIDLAPLSWWAIIVVFAIGIALLLIRKKTGFGLAIFEVIPIDWCIIIVGILLLITKIFL